jgi:hypothetical protein
MPTTPPPAAPFECEWQDDNEIAAEHSQRAVNIVERLEALGCMVLDIQVENWVFYGKVNTRKAAGTPYWHRLYTRRVVITANAPGETGAGSIAIDLEIERYGKEGAVRNGRINVGAPHTRAIGGVWWLDKKDALREAGYLKGYRFTSVLTEGPDAVKAREAIGFNG